MVRRALILLAAHACASSAPPVHTAPPVPEFPCTLEGHQVALESLTMMAPRASDDAQYPFAQVSRAAHIRIEPPVRVITFVRAELETSMLRLHGLASDGKMALHPSSPSVFGGTVIPLASNRLQWRESRANAVLLLPARVRS